MRLVEEVAVAEVDDSMAGREKRARRLVPSSRVTSVASLTTACG
jgi:hypothetical protein